MKTIVLSKREVGLIGLCVFLMYGQFNDTDFDSIIGRTTLERDTALLALKNEISANSSGTSDIISCNLSDVNCEILSRMLSQVNDGADLKEAGFQVSEEEMKILNEKF